MISVSCHCNDLWCKRLICFFSFFFLFISMLASKIRKLSFFLWIFLSWRFFCVCVKEKKEKCTYRWRKDTKKVCIENFFFLRRLDYICKTVHSHNTLRSVEEQKSGFLAYFTTQVRLTEIIELRIFFIFIKIECHASSRKFLFYCFNENIVILFNFFTRKRIN